jgi:hypothetical protein
MNATYPVLLVGSVDLKSAREVFETTSRALGFALKRIPDGETGERSGWVVWQVPRLMSNEFLERQPDAHVNYSSTESNVPPMFRLRAGTDPASVRFAALGYAEAALASYEIFAQIKKSARIASHIRFQVCLPTPLAIIAPFIEPGSQRALEPAFEKRLLEELREICAKIPHDQLAIQWDCAAEFFVLELKAPVPFDDLRAGINERLARIGDAVPHAVELGYHFCYGDFKHAHFKEPTDTSLLVSVANDMFNEIHRPITWLHIPVPRKRDDDAYFAPLENLRLPRGTELFLGLIHFTDGLEGARRRIATATRHWQEFGIATECGMGRRPPGQTDALLEIHRRAAAGLAQ